MTKWFFVIFSQTSVIYYVPGPDALADKVYEVVTRITALCQCTEIICDKWS